MASLSSYFALEILSIHIVKKVCLCKTHLICPKLWLVKNTPSLVFVQEIEDAAKRRVFEGPTFYTFTWFSMVFVQR